MDILNLHMEIKKPFQNSVLPEKHHRVHIEWEENIGKEYPF